MFDSTVKTIELIGNIASSIRFELCLLLGNNICNLKEM